MLDEIALIYSRKVKRAKSILQAWEHVTPKFCQFNANTVVWWTGKCKEMDSSYLKNPWDFLSFSIPFQESVNEDWQMSMDIKR